MFVKILSHDKDVLDGIVKFLYQKKLLLDYAIVFQEAGNYTQIIRVKCNEKDLLSTLRPRFKKNFSIIK